MEINFDYLTDNNERVAEVANENRDEIHRDGEVEPDENVAIDEVHEVEAWNRFLLHEVDDESDEEDGGEANQSHPNNDLLATL